MGKWRILNRIVYHSSITSKPTNQVHQLIRITKLKIIYYNGDHNYVGMEYLGWPLIKETMSRCWYITGWLLWLWRSMLPYLEWKWRIILKISRKSSFNDNLRYHQINKLYCTFSTHFMSISFVTPWKHPKTSGFLMFSGGIKRGQWHEMGSGETW